MVGQFGSRSHRDLNKARHLAIGSPAATPLLDSLQSKQMHGELGWSVHIALPWGIEAWSYKPPM
jgi:hypothetical protein